MSTITCKAAVCWGPDESFKIEQIQVDPPGLGEVRLKILCSSLCHTDVLRWHGIPLPLFPRVLGHEGVGVVESVGDEVTDIKVGDTVIPTFIGECGDCPNCASGKTNLCRTHPFSFSGLMPDGTSRMSAAGGRSLYHLFSCSTFSEYAVVSAHYVVKVDPKLPPPVASLLSCGFTTGFGAVWKEAKVEAGSSVAVFGLGGVGIGAVAGAKMMGAGRIIGIDVNDKKREPGEAFGATDFVNPGKIGSRSAVEVIRELTGGLGVDYSFECCGVAAMLNEAIECTKVGSGLTILIGAGQGVMPVDVRLFLPGRTVKGCVFGGVKPRSDLHLVIDKCLDKELQLEGLVTHEVGLEDINHAFELLKQPDCLKVVIKM